MDGSRVPRMERPSIANETAGVEDVCSIRAAVRHDMKTYHLPTDADLEQASRDASTRCQRLAVDGDGRTCSGRNVHPAVAPEEHEPRRARQRRIERVAPQAVLSDSHSNARCRRRDQALRTQARDARGASQRPPRHTYANVGWRRTGTTQAELRRTPEWSSGNHDTPCGNGRCTRARFDIEGRVVRCEVDRDD